MPTLRWRTFRRRPQGMDREDMQSADGAAFAVPNEGAGMASQARHPKSCQNQDSLDYRIFRILPARLRAASASSEFVLAGFRLWGKGLVGRIEIL